MKSHSLSCGLSLALAFAFSVGLTSGQVSPKAVSHVLDRRNPDNWFDVEIPKSMGEPRRFADVDGGFWDAPDLRITFSYWTFENTPNYVRNRGAASKEELVLVCPSSKQTRIVRTRISSRRAVVQSCKETGASNFRYLYHVSFPRLDVFNGESFNPGTFTLTINYNNRNTVHLAARIADSIRFSGKSSNK